LGASAFPQRQSPHAGSDGYREPGIDKLQTIIAMTYWLDSCCDATLIDNRAVATHSLPMQCGRAEDQVSHISQAKLKNGTRR
jgi:hypothetical protein